ncbi:hypothetical protein ABW19_dt0204715 [Dactylella cylindrospora]|nr:hypothetical protein ABW19_dt0204715 [Dactylella cylindrospora]
MKDSAQRSAYYLQLPFKLAIPYLVVGVLLHWGASLSIFMQTTKAYINPVDARDAERNVMVTIRPLGVGFLYGMAIVLLILLVMMGGLWELAPGMPIVQGKSYAIAIACHPPVAELREGNIALKKIQWGVTSESPTFLGLLRNRYLREDDDAVVEPSHRQFGDMEPVYHISFSSTQVKSPERKVFYA